MLFNTTSVGFVFVTKNSTSSFLGRSNKDIYRSLTMGKKSIIPERVRDPRRKIKIIIVIFFINFIENNLMSVYAVSIFPKIR